MSKALLYNADGLATIEQIAEVTGLTVRGIRKKKGLDDYYVKHVPAISGHGKHVAVYNIQALKLWDALPHKFQERDDMLKTIRKKRDDAGKPRTIPQELWELGVLRMKAAYINHPIRNFRLVCERVCADLHDEGYSEADADKFYKAIKRFEPEKNKIGVFFADPDGDWEALRTANMRRSDWAYNSAKPTYDIISIMTNAGLAGPGYGAGRIIVIDDFKRDAWVNRDGIPYFPKGVAFLDGLTGYPLLFLPCDEITTAAVARGILMVAFSYGIYDDTVWVMENSSSMKNVNITGLVRTLYTPEEFENLTNKTWIQQLYSLGMKPIVHSKAYIAQQTSKSRVEKFFDIVKKEFDTFFSKQFQGGNRHEAVQMTIANMPYFTGKNLEKLPTSLQLVTDTEYWRLFYFFMYWDNERSIIDRPRQKFSRHAKSLGIEKTLRAFYDYFDAGCDRSETSRHTPDMCIERYASMLFFAQPERSKQSRLITIKQQNRNGITCTIDGCVVNIISNKFMNLIGQRVAVLPALYDPTQFVVMVANQPDNPQFLGVFTNHFATTLEDASKFRHSARSERELQNKEVSKVLEQANSNFKPGLSLLRESIKKELNHTPNPNPTNILSEDSTGFIALLEDSKENIEINKHSREIKFTVEPATTEPPINFIDQRRRAMLEKARASLKGVKL